MTHIRIVAKKQPMQFLITEPPRAWVDGVEHALAWNQEVAIPAGPGSHQLAIAYRYMGSDCGKAEATVQADPNVVLSYKGPLFVWSNGKIKAS